MAKNKIDNINSLRIGSINFGYLLHELPNKMKGNMILYINLLILLHASTDRNVTQQVFLMVIQENSNKLFPSMVAHYEVALEYLIIKQEIIYFFEIDTFKLLNLLKWLILNSLICLNDYLTFYNKMGQRGNLGDM